jgi:hypothetical protein
LEFVPIDARKRGFALQQARRRSAEVNPERGHTDAKGKRGFMESINKNMPS